MSINNIPSLILLFCIVVGCDRKQETPIFIDSPKTIQEIPRLTWPQDSIKTNQGNRLDSNCTEKEYIVCGVGVLTINIDDSNKYDTVHIFNEEGTRFVSISYGHNYIWTNKFKDEYPWEMRLQDKSAYWFCEELHFKTNIFDVEHGGYVFMVKNIIPDGYFISSALHCDSIKFVPKNSSVQFATWEEFFEGGLIRPYDDNNAVFFNEYGSEKPLSTNIPGECLYKVLEIRDEWLLLTPYNDGVFGQECEADPKVRVWIKWRIGKKY